MDSSCMQTPDEIIASLVDRYPELACCEGQVRSACAVLAESFRSGGKLLVCGNGGSAADSEHVVGELMKSFRFKRPVDGAFRAAYREANGHDVPEWLEGALPAIALSSHTALSTAFSNDEDPVGSFAQQVYGCGRPGDVLLAISTSGNSRNVVEAAKVARARDMDIISLTGAGRSRLFLLSSACVQVPRDETFQVQELHLPVYHCLCACVEAELYGGCGE